MKFNKLIKHILLEQNSKISDLRKAIIDRKPISITYTGPLGEVLSGNRYDIEPIVMGRNIKSDNMVIWAYVFRGVSKKGLPGWKMFRVDRIQNIDTSKFTGDSFKLADLPDYEKGKAPNAMKSLSSVDIYSPYWFEDYKKNQNKPTIAPPPVKLKPEEPITNIENQPKSQYQLDTIVFNDLKNKVKINNNQKTITNTEYFNALSDLYNRKEGEWKNYQKMVSGNAKPGEGTRKRFEDASKKEIDNLLMKNNISVSDNENTLMEIKKKIKNLIIL